MALRAAAWSDTAQRRSATESGRGMAQGLGWFSIALGVAALAAPRPLGEAIGVGDRSLLIRAIGLRELLGGMGLLAQRQKAPWLWARVAGDGMDLALLGLALASDHHRRDRVGATFAAVLGVAALDAAAGRQASGHSGMRRARLSGPYRAAKTVTINRPASELYRFWRDVENLPRFMPHLEWVKAVDERRSQWRIKAPAGRTIEWESEITEDRPNEQLAWRSLPGAAVENSGSVTFRNAPGGRGTEVRVEFEYRPAGGAMGAVIATLFGREPRQQVQADLRAFKQLMETGEIARAESSFGALKHAAQPPSEEEEVR
ncbi:MAG TPA: SRPBCC family protein [Stellaceae bacterium]|nr:SRPBCC family protein [Stellaceae bacterium]